MRAIGTESVLNGKPVRWAGENYGWQSFGSYEKLKEQGKFRLGTQALDRFTSAVSRATPQPIKNYLSAVQAHQAQQQATKVEAVRNTVGNRAADLVSRNATGQAIEGISKATNVDPRIVGTAATVAQAVIAKKAASSGAPRRIPANTSTRQASGGGVQRGIQRHMQAGRNVPAGEVGAVYPAGHKKAGQYMASGQRAKHQHRDLIEAYGEHVWKNQPSGATSATTKGIPTVQLPNGEILVAKNEGVKNFKPGVKGGITFKIEQPQPGKTYPSVADVIGGKSKPIPAPAAKVEAPKAGPESPSLAQQRFNPRNSPEDPATAGMTRGQKRTYQDSVMRNPALPRDLSRDKMTPIPQGSSRNPQPGTAQYAQNQANARLSTYQDGTVSKPFQVSWTEAHHKTPLKDSYDFLKGMSPEQAAQAKKILEKNGIHLGDTQLNAIHPRRTYHQGDSGWPHAREKAAHIRLRNLRLEGQPGTDRWAHMTPQERLDNIKYFIEDVKAGERIGLDAIYSQHLLQPGNDALNNPYGGNVVQRVLAPESSQAHKNIVEAVRNAKETLRKLKKSL